MVAEAGIQFSECSQIANNCSQYAKLNFPLDVAFNVNERGRFVYKLVDYHGTPESVNIIRASIWSSRYHGQS